MRKNIFILFILLSINCYSQNNSSYNKENYETIVIKTALQEVNNNTIAMVDISALTINLSVGWYKVEFVPLYNVNATTTGTGWDFGGGTATITNYSFRSELPSTTTANYVNNYVARNQNFTTAQTSRINDNRGTIIVEFQCTVAGTLIPRFRSEIAGANVLVRIGSYLKLEKIE